MPSLPPPPTEFFSFLGACMKDLIFSKTARLFLATLLRKWTFSYLFYRKSRYFTEQVWETNSRIGGAYYKSCLKLMASLANWMSVRLWTKWLWVRVPLQSLKLHVSWHFRARNSLTLRRLESVDLLWNMYVTW